MTLPAEPVCARRRPGAAGAGGREPAQQRRQVHATPGGRIAARCRRSGDRAVRCGCATRGIGIPPRCCRASSTCSRRSNRTLGALAGRPRHRPDARRARWSSCTAAPSRRAAHGPGQGSEFIVRLPAASGRRRRRCRGATRARRAAAGGRAASWSSTTTSTRPTPRDAAAPRGQRGPHGARRRSKPSRSAATHPARRRAARHRPAGAERLRGGRRMRARAPGARDIAARRR